MFALPMWAVHISDGILSGQWLGAGFVVALGLALLASWRVREEEVARIGLVTAAFFVASSIHVKIGPSSVHLLLNGLVGVVIGRRAPLAILIGVTLQAALIPHGGWSTIGVNATAQMLPALAAAALFPYLRAGCRGGRTGPLVRASLAALGALLWGGGLVFGVAVLWTGGARLLLSDEAGVVFRLSHLEPALAIVWHPATLLLMVLLACGSGVWQWRSGASPEFPVGALLGMLGVMGAVCLTGLVLLADSAETWSAVVALLVVAHFPLALVEGLILGAIVSFLAKVKPEMLRGAEMPAVAVKPSQAALFLLAFSLLLAAPTSAFAHRLIAEAKEIDTQRRVIRVEAWYETEDPAEEAVVKVLREDDSVLVEGKMSAKGIFTFAYDKAEPLRILITDLGHRATIRLQAEDLRADPTPREVPQQDRWRDLAVGVALILAVAAFVLSVQTARRVRELDSPTGLASDGKAR